MLFFWPTILFSEDSPIILFTQPIILLIILTTIYSTYYINVRNLYNTEQYNLLNTTVSRFTRDALINAHDAYITVELYNNYYIFVILHVRSAGVIVY